VSLAAQISAAARDLGIKADPSRVQTVQIAIDTVAIPEVLPFWKAVLGYDQAGDEDVVDPFGRGPNVWFQQVSPDGPHGSRGHFHVDISVPRDQVEARIAAALAAGGHIVTDQFAPNWWTLADPEGNVVDLAPWRDDDED
jgi:4a-hydroxytetrahydrobiopterin dehydratase